jgi:hypothetical protein
LYALLGTTYEGDGKSLKKEERFMKLRKLITLAALVLATSALSQATDQPKTTSLKGKVFLSNTKQPVDNASIIFLDEKRSDKQDRSVETKTDEQGNYSIPEIAAGSYTVSIRAWYPTQEEAPCQLLMAKTAEKNSTVTVARDKGRFVQQLFIKGFSIKAGKEMTKDFDFTCKSMFGG